MMLKRLLMEFRVGGWIHFLHSWGLKGIWLTWLHSAELWHEFGCWKVVDKEFFVVVNELTFSNKLFSEINSRNQILVASRFQDLKINKNVICAPRSLETSSRAEKEENFLLIAFECFFSYQIENVCRLHRRRQVFIYITTEKVCRSKSFLLLVSSFSFLRLTSFFTVIQW